MLITNLRRSSTPRHTPSLQIINTSFIISVRHQKFISEDIAPKDLDGLNFHYTIFYRYVVCMKRCGISSLFMCICIFVHLHIYICICIYIYRHIYIHINIYIFIYIPDALLVCVSWMHRRTFNIFSPYSNLEIIVMYKEVGITENITIYLMFILPRFALFKLVQESLEVQRTCWDRLEEHLNGEDHGEDVVQEVFT